jgi:hypothetical protein
VDHLTYDRVERLAALGGRRRKAGAQRMPGELLRIEPGALGAALDDPRQRSRGDAPRPAHIAIDGPSIFVATLM